MLTPRPWRDIKADIKRVSAEAKAEVDLRDLQQDYPRVALRSREAKILAHDGNSLRTNELGFSTPSALTYTKVLDAIRNAGSNARGVSLDGGFDLVYDRFDSNSDYAPETAVWSVELTVEDK